VEVKSTCKYHPFRSLKILQSRSGRRWNIMERGLHIMHRPVRTIAVAVLLLSPAHGQDIDSTSHTVQFIAVENNVKLEVLDWGGSGRPLVLLAGLGDTAHAFDKCALGIAAGIVSALILTRLMSTMLVGIKPTDPATFVSMTALFFAISVLACYLPARRAAGLDPMTTLREQ
jgi:hypothetical protein